MYPLDVRSRLAAAALRCKKGGKRCLKRQLSYAVFRALVHNPRTAEPPGPGGHSGRLR